MEKVTIGKILAYIKDKVENNIKLHPEVWLDTAQKLNVLLEDADDQIAVYEALMAEDLANNVGLDISVAKAEAIKIKAIDYEDYLKKKALVKRVQEHIRLAKKRSQIVSDRYNEYN